MRGWLFLNQEQTIMGKHCRSLRISCRQTVRQLFHPVLSVLKQSNGPRKPSRRCFGSIAATSVTNSAEPCNYLTWWWLFKSPFSGKFPVKFFCVYLNLLNVQEIKSEVNLGASPRQLPVDPSTVYGQGILQSKPGMGSAGKWIQCNAYGIIQWQLFDPWLQN